MWTALNYLQLCNKKGLTNCDGARLNKGPSCIDCNRTVRLSVFSEIEDRGSLQMYPTDVDLLIPGR